jgi:hypothetical protein
VTAGWRLWGQSLIKATAPHANTLQTKTSDAGCAPHVQSNIEIMHSCFPSASGTPTCSTCAYFSSHWTLDPSAGVPGLCSPYPTVVMVTAAQYTVS